MNRKRLFLALVLGVALVLLCMSAALADDPMKVSMELSTNKFTEPKAITVSITVTNVGDGDMPGPVTLYYPSGKKVDEFGSPTLSVGASKNWSGSWTVTQSELEAGKITFMIKYSMYGDEEDENGEPKLVPIKKRFSKKIVYSGADPELTVTRTITPTTAQKGQEVSVVYDISNSGSVDVSSVTIKENSGVSSKSGTIEAIPVGETAHYTFTATMGNKDLTSAATITYKAGGKSFTTKVDPATIKYGEVKLTATLTADKKGGAPGETVKLTLKLKNSGTVDFTNVTVTDPALGTVFSGETVPAGQTVTLEKDLTITETQELQFTVKGEDTTGSGVETATGRIQVIATDPTQQIVLSVEAEADRTQVYRIPGSVRFKVTVHNDSAVEVKNITVKAVDVTLYSFESIPAGGSASFIRDTEISMAGNFEFTASCKDQLGQTLKFTSEPIHIEHVAPTAEPTEAPVVTPPAPAYETVPPSKEPPEWLEPVENLAGILKYVFAFIGVCLFTLLLIGAIRRGRRRSESRKAMDHLEGATYRDYSTAPKRRRRSEISNGNAEVSAPAETEAAAEQEGENTAQSSELMAETLKRLYADKPETKEAVEEAAAEVKETAEEAVAETAEKAEGAAAEAAETVKEAAEQATEAPAEAAKEVKAAVESAGEATHRRRTWKK